MLKIQIVSLGLITTKLLYNIAGYYIKSDFVDHCCQKWWMPLFPLTIFTSAVKMMWPNLGIASSHLLNELLLSLKLFDFAVKSTVNEPGRFYTPPHKTHRIQNLISLTI